MRTSNIHQLIRPLSLSLMWLCLILNWGVAGAQQSGQLTARVDRLQVGDTESFKLILEVKDGTNIQQPDLSVLEKDFNVLRTATQTFMQLVNGTTTRTTEIHITLSAKHVGNLRIPPIKMGQAESNPISITVTNAPTQFDQSTQGSIFIEVDAQPSTTEKLYVQSQLSLVVRLFYPDGLTQGNLDHPEVNNTVIELLEELKYTSRRGNRQLNVLERRYSIQPERSGELTIPPIRFIGRISRSNRRSLFSTGVGRQVRAASDQMSFQVLAQPPEFSGDLWLPARRMEMSLEQDKTEVRVGDPVNRTITISAMGLSHTQLPELPQQEVLGGRVYPNAGEAVTVHHERWMVAQREFQQAIVPSEVGTLLIPDLEIEWWDVTADEQKTLLVPGAEIQVLAPLGSEPASTPVDAVDRSSGELNATNGTVANAVYWHWSNVALAVLWMVTLLLWWLDRRRGIRAKPETNKAPALQLKQAREALRSACQTNNGHLALQSLLDWGRALWPQNPPVSVHEICLRLDQNELTQAVQALQESRYAKSERSWQGSSLWAAIEPIQSAPKVRKPTKAESVLPDLYPQP